MIQSLLRTDMKLTYRQSRQLQVLQTALRDTPADLPPLTWPFLPIIHHKGSIHLDNLQHEQ
jgi:hypothetical protein